MHAREIAYLATVFSFRNEKYAEQTLDEWNQKFSPSPTEYHFAKKITHGTIQMKAALAFLAEKLAEKPLKLKQKERILLYNALYQRFFLERIPLYAIGHETVNLAKKYCHPTFVGYLNVLMRKLEKEKIELPQDDKIQSLAIRYSYPIFYVKKLIQQYGLIIAKDILQAGNTPPQLTIRIRNMPENISSDLEIITKHPFLMARIKNPESIATLATSSNYYIQSATQAALLGSLSAMNPKPKTILDLCAAPGGKLLALHDLFPKAKLFANDLSSERLKLLEQNCEKYGLRPTLFCQPGETIQCKNLFDLIVVDAPCSNTGVLNKRPEARWRLSEKSIHALKTQQINLLRHALSLVTAHGEVWYLTCSILKDENEEVVKNVGASIRHTTAILPNPTNPEGGYSFALQPEV